MSISFKWAEKQWLYENFSGTPSLYYEIYVKYNLLFKVHIHSAFLLLKMISAWAFLPGLYGIWQQTAKMDYRSDGQIGLPNFEYLQLWNKSRNRPIFPIDEAYWFHFP